MPGSSNRETSARRTRQVTMGDLFCRAAYGSLFLDALGRVQSTTLPKISVDEAADFIVHRRRMEAPAQEWAGETVIVIVMAFANKPISLSALRFANSGDDFPTSISPSVHLNDTHENLNWIGTDLSHRVANQISLTCYCDFFFKQPVAIRASNFARRELAIGAVAHKQCTVVLGSSDH